VTVNKVHYGCNQSSVVCACIEISGRFVLMKQFILTIYQCEPILTYRARSYMQIIQPRWITKLI